MDGGIEIVQTGESHSLYVQVNGTVEKLHYGECNIMRSVTNNSMYINSIIGKRSA